MTRSGRLIPHQRADGWCESADGFIKAKSPQSGEPERILSKADGARPLQRGAMLVVFFCSVTTTKAITRNKRFVPASES